jgi:hypothetical protein
MKMKVDFILVREASGARAVLSSENEIRFQFLPALDGGCSFAVMPVAGSLSFRVERRPRETAVPTRGDLVIRRMPYAWELAGQRFVTTDKSARAAAMTRQRSSTSTLSAPCSPALTRTSRRSGGRQGHGPRNPGAWRHEHRCHP